jgi:hypothetical protein
VFPRGNFCQQECRKYGFPPPVSGYVSNAKVCCLFTHTVSAMDAAGSDGGKSDDEDVVLLGTAEPSDETGTSDTDNPAFVWEPSAIDASKHNVVTSFKGGIYDYFVIVKRGDELYGHCRLLPLALAKGRKFTKDSNSNLWSLLRNKFPSLQKRLQEHKQTAVKPPPPPVPAAVAMKSWLDSCRATGVSVARLRR